MKKNFKRIVSVALAVLIAVSTLAVSVVSTSALENYEYTVTFNTGSKLGAGTDADVYLYAYDADGNQIDSRIKIDTEGNSFEKGDTDIATINSQKEINSIKVAIFHDVDGNLFENLANDYNEWYLNDIKLTDSNGNTKTFTFNQWIDPGFYAHHKTVRNRFSFPKLKTVYVQEKEILYAPVSIN